MALECERIDFLSFQSISSCVRKQKHCLPRLSTWTLGYNLEPCFPCSWYWVDPAPPHLCLPPHVRVLKPLLSHIASSLDPWDVPHHTRKFLCPFLIQCVLFRTPWMNYKDELIIAVCWLNPGRALYKLWRKWTLLLKSTRSVVLRSHPPLQPILTPLRSLLTIYMCEKYHVVPCNQLRRLPVGSLYLPQASPWPWVAGSLILSFHGFCPLGGVGVEGGKGRGRGKRTGEGPTLFSVSFFFTTPP